MRYWHIEGYDSTTKIYDRKVNIAHFSDKQIQTLLMALVAKAGLDFDEIVGAYVSKRSKTHNNLLSVHKNGQYPIFSCGNNPHFIVKVVETNA